MTQAMAGGASPMFGQLPGLARGTAHWTLALASTALVAGLVMWGHDTMTRETQGVPVVRAFAGKMRIDPSETGGDTVPYRELTVGRIAEGHGVAPAPNVVRVRATGTDLSTDDFVRAPEGTLAEAAPVDEGAARQTATDRAVMSVVLAAQAIPEGVPGIARSPRPAGRPRVIAAAARQTADARGGGSGRELDAASLPSGTPLAQLGAFPDEASARAAWAKLSAAHESLLGERDRLVIEVPVAGRVLWRLRVAGFGAREDAVRFCTAMSAAGSECIPTTHG